MCRPRSGCVERGRGVTMRVLVSATYTPGRCGCGDRSPAPAAAARPANRGIRPHPPPLTSCMRCAAAERVVHAGAAGPCHDRARAGTVGDVAHDAIRGARRTASDPTTSGPCVEGVSVSVLLWLLVPLAVTAVTAATRRRLEARRPRPVPRELVRRAVVVLPAHEDARAQLRAVARVLDTDPRVDVLIVDSSSAEQAVVDEVSPRVTVLRHPDVTSGTEALQVGAARGLTRGYDAVIELPVRHSHLARRITALLEALDDGAHVAVGSRYIPGGRVIGCPYARRIASRGVNVALRWMTGAPVSDVTAPVRVYRREAVECALLPASGVDRALGIDVMLRCRNTGLRVTEVPVTVAGPLCAAVTPADGRALLVRAVMSRRRTAPTPDVIDLTDSAARV